MSALLSRPPRPVAPLSWADVVDVTLAAGFPSISVLLPTAPAAAMTPSDADRLEALVDTVRSDLAGRRVAAADRLLDRLTEEVDRAAAQPTGHGLAIFVSDRLQRSFRLPIAVPERAVVEQTFATRDLVRTMHRTPPYVVLWLSDDEARLHQAVGDRLDLVERRRRTCPESRWLAEVDILLGAYRTRYPSPLVLAGDPATIDEFTVTSRHLSRLAGRVHAAAIADLAEASAAAVASYLRTRRADALALLERTLADRSEDVARGITDCWTAVHRSTPRMLLVEDDFVSPGSVSPLPRQRQVHDLVDDLIEMVVVRGGQVAIVGPGELADHDRIALVTAGW